LNGAYLGSWVGSNAITQGELTLSFANATLASENVLFVIQDHMGKDQTSGAVNPRGIFNATLIGGGNFTSWKVTGNAGGENNIDPVRGLHNEGGLHAERLGWHLPGFDDRNWKSGAPEKGLKEAGVSFYRTVVPLDIPRGVDVSLGFVLDSPAGSHLRAQLYVNGYMFAKYIPHIGNQIVFPGQFLSFFLSSC
jgi:beta-galactosidase GanA